MRLLDATLPLIALLCTACPTVAIADGKLVYPDYVSRTFEKEDAESGKNGVKKCEISITMVKPSDGGVDFRVKLMTTGRRRLATLTVDAVDFTVSNGIPYDFKKKTISSASIVSKCV